AYRSRSSARPDHWFHARARLAGIRCHSARLDAADDASLVWLCFGADDCRHGTPRGALHPPHHCGARMNTAVAALVALCASIGMFALTYGIAGWFRSAAIVEETLAAARPAPFHRLARRFAGRV